MAPSDAKVTIDYVMAAAAGRFGFSVIDRTKDHEEPFTFKLNDPSVIAGLQEGVSTMRAGGVRRLIIPSSLSYTDQSKAPSPSIFINYQACMCPLVSQLARSLVVGLGPMF